MRRARVKLQRGRRSSLPDLAILTVEYGKQLVEYKNSMLSKEIRGTSLGKTRMIPRDMFIGFVEERGSMRRYSA